MHNCGKWLVLFALFQIRETLVVAVVWAAQVQTEEW